MSNRSQTVVVDGCESTPLKIEAGVPQGSVLGPLLFLVYINDLGLKLDSEHHFFADDTQLFRANEPENIQIYKLNQDLKQITQ